MFPHASTCDGLVDAMVVQRMGLLDFITKGKAATYTIAYVESIRWLKKQAHVLNVQHGSELLVATPTALRPCTFSIVGDACTLQQLLLQQLLAGVQA